MFMPGADRSLCVLGSHCFPFCCSAAVYFSSKLTSLAISSCVCVCVRVCKGALACVRGFLLLLFLSDASNSFAVYALLPIVRTALVHCHCKCLHDTTCPCSR